jgi:hypothetical protein
MNAKLPRTGTVRLLTLLDPHIPDGFINDRWNVRPAQLWRTRLLTVLAPAHFGHRRPN